MIRRNLRNWQHAGPRCAAFTLIELLTVIAIILVLAALLLNVAGHAQYKSALSRAQGEIQQISTGLESYKVDNGTYPRATPLTGSGTPPSDALNPNAAGTSSDMNPVSAKYYLSGELLFQELSGSHSPFATANNTKAYITFLPSQLSTGNAAFVYQPAGTGGTYIIDPFGLCYGYSTANQAAVEASQASPPPASTPDPAKTGYNPTFDLWSTAGYVPNGSGGKSYPSTITATSSPGYESLWIKNW